MLSCKSVREKTYDKVYGYRIREIVGLIPCTAIAISSRIRFASALVAEKKLASADANPILRRCEPTLNNFDSKPVQFKYRWIVQHG